MRDGVTLRRRLSLAELKPRISPDTTLSVIMCHDHWQFSVQQLVQEGATKVTSRLGIAGPLWENTQDSSHKGPLMRKAFPYDSSIYSDHSGPKIKARLLPNPSVVAGLARSSSFRSRMTILVAPYIDVMCNKSRSVVPINLTAEIISRWLP